MLPSIHDHTLLGYRVSLEHAEIVLRTNPNQCATAEPVSEQEVFFQGVAAHHFEYVNIGTILGHLVEWPLEDFVKQHVAQFDAGYTQSGWPDWWQGTAPQAVTYLQTRGLRAFEVTSAYGLDGWVLAREIGVLRSDAAARTKEDVSDV